MIDSTPWANRPHAGRRTVPLKLSPDQRSDIEMAMRPEKAERRIVLRAQALLFMADGVPASDIAMVLGVAETQRLPLAETLRVRPSRAEAGGRPAIGTAALSLSKADCATIVAEACRPPSDVGVPVTHWSIALFGDYLRQNAWLLSDATLRRILLDAKLQPHRQKMWLTSQDDEFRAKRDDILHLYYDAPEHEQVISVDEKTSIQALERRYPDLAMEPGQVVRREFEYIRHGTLC